MFRIVFSLKIQNYCKIFQKFLNYTCFSFISTVLKPISNSSLLPSLKLNLALLPFFDWSYFIVLFKWKIFLKMNVEKKKNNRNIPDNNSAKEKIKFNNSPFKAKIFFYSLQNNFAFKYSGKIGVSKAGSI